MNDLQRAARLVVATHFRYSGHIPHIWDCACQRGPEEDCDCGADDFNSALTILKDLFKASGDLPALTGAEVKAEINDLNTQLQKGA